MRRAAGIGVMTSLVATRRSTQHSYLHLLPTRLSPARGEMPYCSEGKTVRSTGCSPQSGQTLIPIGGE